MRLWRYARPEREAWHGAEPKPGPAAKDQMVKPWKDNHLRDCVRAHCRKQARTFDKRSWQSGPAHVWW